MHYREAIVRNKAMVAARRSEQATDSLPTAVHSFLIHWQASHDSGFSSEQANASVSARTAAGAAPSVAFAIFVAGRERR